MASNTLRQPRSTRRRVLVALAITGCTTPQPSVSAASPAAATPTSVHIEIEELHDGVPWYGDLVQRERPSLEVYAPVEASAPKARSERAPTRGPIPSAELPSPTEAELRAWDRKDPEGEKHLYKWDKANFAALDSYWRELQCLHFAVRSSGDASLTGGDPKWWEGFRLNLSTKGEGWLEPLVQQGLLGKSKFFSQLIEGYELAVYQYPEAYEGREAMPLMRLDAHWLIVENKIEDYAERLEESATRLDPANTADLEACRSFLDGLD